VLNDASKQDLFWESIEQEDGSGKHGNA